MKYIRGGQRASKLPVLFQTYMLQVMYMTFQYLTVLCIPHTGHVYDISVPDSFMYISATGRVYDISVPGSFMYIYVSATGHVPNIF